MRWASELHLLTRDRSTAYGPMSRFNKQPALMASGAAAPPPMQRTSQRVTITLSWAVHQRLQERCDLEGRSFSNLAAYMLESAVSQR